MLLRWLRECVNSNTFFLLPSLFSIELRVNWYNLLHRLLTCLCISTSFCCSCRNISLPSKLKLSKSSFIPLLCSFNKFSTFTLSSNDSSGICINCRNNFWLFSKKRMKCFLISSCNSSLFSFICFNLPSKFFKCSLYLLISSFCALNLANCSFLSLTILG